MKEGKKTNQSETSGLKNTNTFKDQVKQPALKTKNNKKRSRDSYIPKVVANRMARRIAFTTGIPTILGMSVFIGSYLLIIKGIKDVPPSVTLTSSAICFLIGLFGLSYGILSASWEDNPGSLLGIENIRPNISKMQSAFKSTSPEGKKRS